MESCNAVSTPLEVGNKLIKGEPWSDSGGKKPPYRELIGCLLYLSVATRPDIAHAASLLSQYNDCFNKNHWKAAKRVLRYLSGTSNYGIFFGRDHKPVTGFVDADWGGSTEDRRSFTGYAFLMGDGVVTWNSRKQRTVALSTVEAEYMALSEAAKEAVHLGRFLEELNGKRSPAITIFNDNMGAQRLGTNSVFHSRTKHIDIRHHFVREVIESGQIILQHVGSDSMPADVLTKPLLKAKHEMLGLREPQVSKAQESVSRGSVGVVGVDSDPLSAMLTCNKAPCAMCCMSYQRTVPDSILSNVKKGLSMYDRQQ